MLGFYATVIAQKTSDLLLSLGKREFTADTIFDDGVLEKYLPFIKWQGWGAESSVRALGEYVEQVLITEVRKSTPDVAMDDLKNLPVFLRLSGLRDAYPFLQRFAPHVEQDQVVCGVFITSARPINEDDASERISDEYGPRVDSWSTFKLVKTQWGFGVEHNRNFASDQNLTLLEALTWIDPLYKDHLLLR